MDEASHTMTLDLRPPELREISALSLSAGTGHTRMPRLLNTPSTCTSFLLLFFLPPGTLEPTALSPSHHPALQKALGFPLCGSLPCQSLSLSFPWSMNLAQRSALTPPSLMPLGPNSCISHHLFAPDPQTLTSSFRSEGLHLNPGAPSPHCSFLSLLPPSA